MNPLDYILGVWGNIKYKVKNFDWHRLIPVTKTVKYSYLAFGIELTMPWHYEGMGFGFGLGKLDLWVGWPRLVEA